MFGPVRRALAPLALATRDYGIRQGFEHGGIDANLRPVLVGGFLQFCQRQAVQARKLGDRYRRRYFTGVAGSEQRQDLRLVARQRIEQFRCRLLLGLDQQIHPIEAEAHTR